jgi:hypothetical protein
MSTAVSDLLQIDMRVTGTAWKQTILDVQTLKSVDFMIDLMFESPVTSCRRASTGRTTTHVSSPARAAERADLPAGAGLRFTDDDG